MMASLMDKLKAKASGVSCMSRSQRMLMLALNKQVKEISSHSHEVKSHSKRPTARQLFSSQSVVKLPKEPSSTFNTINQVLPTDHQELRRVEASVSSAETEVAAASVPEQPSSTFETLNQGLPAELQELRRVQDSAPYAQTEFAVATVPQEPSSAFETLNQGLPTDHQELRRVEASVSSAETEVAVTSVPQEEEEVGNALELMNCDSIVFLSVNTSEFATLEQPIQVLVMSAEDQAVQELSNDNVNQAGTASAMATAETECMVPSESRRNVRKKMRNEKMWKRNQLKATYNSGQTIKFKGQEKERKIGTCGSCRRKCIEKIISDKQQELYDNFWSMGDQKRRADFIISHTKRMPVKRSSTCGKKHYSYYYFLPTDEGLTAVCKLFFLRTFGISERMVIYAHDHKQIIGVAENRVPRVAPNKTPDSVLQGIRTHIESFPMVDSHYRRKDSKKQYLEHGLNLAMMYRMYIERCKETKSQPAKECTYRKIFNTEYNLSFHVPSNDQCGVCSEVRIAGESDEAFEAHIRRKDQIRTAKEEDKAEIDGRITATFDLQQVLTAPKLNVGSAYYLRKLNVYNFCVYELQTHQGFAYVWDESQANRGANEIATGLYEWLLAKDRENYQECVLYSDSCGGQNRNRIMCTMIISFLSQSNSIRKVQQKYFEPGHSFMECDSMHSLIERKVKNSQVYGPSDYAEIIRTCCIKKAYQVKMFDHNAFISWSDVNKSACRQNAFDGISKVHWIAYEKEGSDVKVTFKEEISGDPGVLISYRKRGRQTNLTTLDFPHAYSTPVGIDGDKKKDLESLMKFLPPDRRSFFQSVPVKKTPPAASAPETEAGSFQTTGSKRRKIK